MQIQHMEDNVFKTKQAAEQHGLELSKEWGRQANGPKLLKSL
jgi:hypothetical protein